MPLLSKTEENNATILIWKLTESIQELEKISSFINTSYVHSEKRKKEFICSRLLLKEYNPNLQISYSENGSPILSNEKFIKRADKQFQKVADKLNEAINQQGNKKLQKVMGQ